MAEDDAVEHAYLLASRMDYTITYHDKEISLTAKIKLAKRDTKGTKIRVLRRVLFITMRITLRGFFERSLGNKRTPARYQNGTGRCPFCIIF